MVGRYANRAVIGGILLYYTGWKTDTYIMGSLAALVVALSTSHTRARAESLIERCKVGIFQRPGKVVVLMAADVADWIAAALWASAAVGHIAVPQGIGCTARLRERHGESWETGNRRE